MILKNKPKYEIQDDGIINLYHIVDLKHFFLNCSSYLNLTRLITWYL